jgi:hypothetical protein
MTERQLMLLKNSWGFMMIRSQDVTTLFYLKICESLPFVGTAVKSRMKEQAARLIHMITLILTKFHHPQDILTEIKQVHEWKKRYGLRDEDYITVVNVCCSHSEGRLEKCIRRKSRTRGVLPSQ